jgi:hypothetical protein
MARASRRDFLGGAAVGALSLAAAPRARAADARLTVSTPMAAPDWALLQRELLRANAEACQAFYERYYDQASGYFLCFERWGANDGPDDAIENVNDWPQLHALGGSERIVKTMYDARLRRPRAPVHGRPHDPPSRSPASRACIYKEFNVQLDWQHQCRRR